jgi:nucleotide-binding universal stress UspA family protein
MKKIQNIMVALTGDKNEQAVVSEAVRFTEQLNGTLTAIRVNDIHAGEMSMMMDSPKEIKAETIRSHIIEYGFKDYAEKIDIRIVEGEDIGETIAENCSDCDLLIVGHRKMSDFKAGVSDSTDEGITNEVPCPVLVVEKKVKKG